MCSGYLDEPPDDEPFDANAVGVICDGDWPRWPAQEMLDWMPEDIVARYGVVSTSNFNGDFLSFPDADGEKIAADLAALGVEVTRDDDLVFGICVR